MKKNQVEKFPQNPNRFASVEASLIKRPVGSSEEGKTLWKKETFLSPTGKVSEVRETWEKGNVAIEKFRKNFGFDKTSKPETRTNNHHIEHSIETTRRQENNSSDNSNPPPVFGFMIVSLFGIVFWDVDF